ncbi:hypothetical protein M422DRAFT_24297 [Sphaerobolus stellatus SS14]|nr:hypothetical protein M422DRAFT_24297 [Sphaerobolus stellatus SS14]
MAEISSTTTLVESNKAIRPQITISKVNVSDSDDLAELVLLAFREDPNGACFHPDRVGYSAEELLAVHKAGFSWEMRKEVLRKGIYLKATIPTTDAYGRPNSTTTVGLSIWENPSHTRLYRLSLWEWLLKTVIYPLQQVIFRKQKSKGIPPEVRDVMKAQYATTFGPGGVAEGQTPWYLHVLAVHPKWQGIGVGKALIEWGMERAREDGAPVYLESSPIAYKFYLGLGYQETVATTCFANGASARIPGMIWFPRMKA